MNRLTQSVQDIFSVRILMLVGLLIAGALLGPAVSILHVGTREIAILFIGVVFSLLILMPTERAIQIGTGLWVISFALGWRTIHINDNFSLHPAEILGFILCVLILARGVIRHTPVDLKFPLGGMMLMGLGVIGIGTALTQAKPLDVALQSAKTFFALVPTFWLVQWSIKSEKDYRAAILLSIIVATYVGCLGLMDLFAPSLSKSLAGQVLETSYLSTSFAGQTFTRIGFVFYGSFLAGFLIFMFLGFTLYHLWANLNRNKTRALLFGACFAIQLTGIYLSGYRGLWYAVAVFILAYAVVQPRAWLMVAAGLLAIPFLPVEFLDRFQSLYNSQFADSSQYDRLQRASGALDQIQRSPIFGFGWAGSGYVHSDLLQTGADLGLPALMVMVGWMVNIIVELVRISQRSDWVGAYGAVLFATMCGMLVALAGEGFIVFVQLAIPFWFLIAMSYKLMAFAATPPASERLESPSAATATQLA